MMVGTSGMKAAMNGGLTFSVSDGWWDEMATDDTGWTIPTVESGDREHRDRLEADALYDILEHRIAPRAGNSLDDGSQASTLCLGQGACADKIEQRRGDVGTRCE